MRRLFLLVAAIVLVDMMFYAAITPLLPHYVEEFGLTKSAAGTLTAAYAAGTVVGAIPGGWLAARFDVKATVFVGLSLMSVSGFTFGFGEHIAVLDAARFLQGIGGAFSWAGAMSWLVAASPRARRGEVIGSAIAASIAGILLGPTLGGIAVVAGPEIVFTAVAIAGVGLAVAAWKTPNVSPSPRTGTTMLLTVPILLAFWLVLLPAQFSGILNVLVPLRLDTLGGGGVFVGVAFLVAGGFEALASRSFGAVSDRRGRAVPIYVGLAGSVVASLLMPLPGSLYLVAAALVAAVVATALFWAPASALLSDYAEDQGLDQGFAFAFVNLAWAGGQMIGGICGGRLADGSGDSLPYFISALLFAITLVALFASALLRRARAGQGGDSSSWLLP